MAKIYQEFETFALTLTGEIGGVVEARFSFSLLVGNGHCTIVSMSGKIGLKYYFCYKYIYILYT